MTLKLAQFCDDPKKISKKSSYPQKYSFFGKPPKILKFRILNPKKWAEPTYVRKYQSIPPPPPPPGQFVDVVHCISCLTERLLMGRKESNQTKQNQLLTNGMNNHPLSINRVLRYRQTVWIHGQIRHFVWPDLDPNCQYETDAPVITLTYRNQWDPGFFILSALL